MLLDALTFAVELFLFVVPAVFFAFLFASVLSANWRLRRGHRENKSLADAPAGSWQGPPFDRMDAALVRPFIHDLESMTPDEIRECWREVQEQLHELESWAEALHAWARLKNIDLH